MRLIVALLLSLTVVGRMPMWGQDARLISRYLPTEPELTTILISDTWNGVPGVVTSNDAYGNFVNNHSTEIRSRWTEKNLYLLFICHYRDLNVTQSPDRKNETHNIWEHDVFQTMLSTDPKRPQHYNEFDMSPLGEFADLEIDLLLPARDQQKWNSGFTVLSRLDEDRKIWYGTMRIPWSSIEKGPIQAGYELRANFFRLQGSSEARVRVAWRPTNSNSFHKPQAFGTIVLEKPEAAGQTAPPSAAK